MCTHFFGRAARAVAFPVLVCSLAVPLGCGGSNSAAKQTIAEVAQAKAEDSAAPKALTTKQRLRVQDMVAPGGGAAPHGGAGPMASPAGDAAAFEFTVPEGWQDEAATAMRQVNLKVGEASECYVSVLGGGGGGLASNLNRWRKQMGQPELSEAEVAALPKKPLLGHEATFISIDGAFSGMGGAEAKPDYRMLGLALVSDVQAVFVKLTGPRAEVEAQTAKFDAFCASLAEGHGGHSHAEETAHAEAPAPTAPAAASAPVPAPAATPAPSAGDSPFKAVTPQGWTEAATSAMRQLNYTVGSATECYVTVLGGTAGGLASNVNRWRKQMGQPDLGEAEIAALPKRTLLGKEATLVSIDGAFSGMGAAEAKTGYRMLGLVQVADGRSVFVKMVGPQQEVEQQTPNFEAFTGSLSEGGAAAPAPSPTPAPAPAPAASAAPAAPAGGVTPPPMLAASAGTFDASKIQWSAPPSWQQGPERTMRLVTYNVGKSECYITVLGGAAGGVEANLNRWRGQLEQPALTAEEIAKLPTLKILGKDAPFLQVSGTYTTMSGEPLPGQTLLGAICLTDSGMLTVKMTGPEAEVASELENFKSFCTSIVSN